MKNAEVLQMMQKVTDVMTGSIITNDHLDSLRNWFRLEEVQATEDGTRIIPAMLICKALIEDLMRTRAAQLTVPLHTAIDSDAPVDSETTKKSAPKPRSRAKAEETPPAAPEPPTEPAGASEPDEERVEAEAEETAPAPAAETTGETAPPASGDW